MDARNRAKCRVGFLLNSKNRKYRGWSAARPPGGRPLGSPPRQSGQQGEQTDWLVPVCRGPLGPGLLIRADRPARLAMLPRACGRQSGPSARRALHVALEMVKQQQQQQRQAGASAAAEVVVVEMVAFGEPLPGK